MSTTALIIFEDPGWRRFGPLTDLRPIWDLRVGLQTLGDRISTKLDVVPAAQIARSGLKDIIGEAKVGKIPARGDVYLVNGRFAGEIITEGLSEDQPYTIWTDGTDVAAAKIPAKVARKWFTKPSFDPRDYSAQSLLSAWNAIDPVPTVQIIEAKGSLIWWPWDLLDKQEHAIQEQLASRGAVIDGDIHHKAILVEESTLYIEKGACVGAGAILDSSRGPILLEEDVEIMPGAIVLGPVALGSGTIVKAGAKLYGPVVAGPRCKLGGEIEGCCILGYSNKQHEGFLGHALVGEWVNLGADTNNSDLKNNYSSVTVQIGGEPIDTERTFFGGIIGDHVKTAINTQLNTGTIIGVGSNLFGVGFPPKEIGAFRWGGAEGFEYYDYERFISTAKVVMERRDVKLSHAMIALLRKLHQEAVAGRL